MGASGEQGVHSSSPGPAEKQDADGVLHPAPTPKTQPASCPGSPLRLVTGSAGDIALKSPPRSLQRNGYVGKGERKGLEKNPVVKYIYTAWNKNYKGSRFLKGLGVRPLPRSPTGSINIWGLVLGNCRV